MYSPKAVVAWFHKTLGVDRLAGNEIQTACPECNSDKFYFNAKKQVGVCHKASCAFTPNLEDLIEIIGFPPGADGVYDKEEEQKKELGPLELPGWPILQMVNGQLMTTNTTALAYLRGRGLTDKIITNWRLTCDGQRIYIPVYSNGLLVNYNSRLLPGLDGRKYLYAKGRSTGSYILGWEECRDWTRLALVENSFVSLWLRGDLHCSSVFGSSISNVQAGLIGRSRIRRVAILWDAGAERKADLAIRKLHDVGVKAAYWRIKEQPDDYPKDQVIAWAERVFEAADQGIPYVDFTE
jgi:hypothetical protein